MKKVALPLLLFVSTLGSAVAQPGIRAGYNLTTLGGDASGNKELTGFHAGLFFEKRNEKTSTVFEVTYSGQGTENSTGSKLNYHYVLLPVLFNFHLNETLFAQLGAQPAILINADVDGADVTSQINAFDFAGVLGLGVEMSQIVLNARYNYGLTTTPKQASGHFPNMVFQISLGYRLKSW